MACSWVMVFSSLSASWAAETEDQACARIYARMEEKLQADYAVSENAVLPSRVALQLGPGDPERFFEVLKKLWTDGFDRKNFRSLVRKVGETGQASQDEARELKGLRARLKQLRFAYMAFDRNHEYPEVVDELASAMGHLQDAIKVGTPDQIKKEAAKLDEQLSKSSVAKLGKELKDFKPTSHKSFSSWRKEELRDLRKLLEKKTMTARQIHDARKILARQNAVYFLDESFRPSRDEAQVVDYLSNLNNKFGTFHDKLIEKKINGQLDYKKDPVELPEDLRRLARQFLDKAESEGL